MKLPAFLNTPVTRAQINHPVLAGKVIRRLTGSSGKKKSGGAESAASASAAASTAAAAPQVTRATLTRTNGVEAAKIAAGVPAGH